MHHGKATDLLAHIDRIARRDDGATYDVIKRAAGLTAKPQKQIQRLRELGLVTVTRRSRWPGERPVAHVYLTDAGRDALGGAA